MVAGRRPGRDAAADLGRDPVHLVGGRGKGLEPDGRRRGRGPLRPEALAHAGADLQAVRVVEADQAVGGVEDRRERAVVTAQDHGPGRRVPVAEPEDVVDGRAAEGVDGLVVIADHGHVAVPLGEQAHELRLRPVGVLELVHDDVAEPPRHRRPRRRRSAQEPERERHLVPEVDAAVGREQALVGLVRAGELGLPSRGLEPACRLDRIRPGRGRQRGRLGGDPVGEPEVVRRGDVLVLAPAEERGQRREEAGRVAERAIQVEVELEQVLAQEDHDLGTRQHPDVGRQAELERVVADERVAEGMERGDRRVRVAIRHELVDAERHLLGRLVGEGQREDLRRSRPPRRDQPGDPARDHLGLARPRAGHDQQRAVLVGHRSTLVGVQAAQQRRQPWLVRGGEGRVHHRDEVAPGGKLVERAGLAATTTRRPARGSQGRGWRWGRGARGGGHARTIAERRDS